MALSTIQNNSFADTAVHGYRNLIINGAMQVAQRGTSASVTTAGYSYDALDRFECYRNSSYAPNFTISQDATGPDGFSTSLKIDVDATATPTGSQNFGIRTKVEGFDAVQTGLGTSGSKQITLSFYVKSNKTGTYGTQVFRNGTTDYSTTKGYTIDAADTWERKEITYTALTTDNTPEVESGWGIMIHFDLSSGPDDIIAPFDWTAQGGARTVTGQVNLMDNTSNYWQITGVQLEVGSEPTPFEHRPYADELQRCERYFWRANKDNTGENIVGTGFWAASSIAFVHVFFPTKMRVVPTASVSAVSDLQWLDPGIAWHTGTTFGSLANTRSTRLNGSVGGTATAKTSSELRINNSSGWIAFDAEL
jgi:hypothetical protein